MRITRIYIGDFGILRNQTMDNINPGLVAIEGVNRAGKTTLMKVLRGMGYGYRACSNIPPASGEYEISCDVSVDDGVYNIRIDGFSKPQVNCIQGKKMTIEDIYQMDSFAYQNIYTISLDQLKSIPDGLSTKEGEKLQSILLGAGLGDLINISTLESSFLKEADKIGGKLGSPAVKEFKPYYNQIKDGVKGKEEAIKQVKEYAQLLQSLKRINDEIKNKEEEINQLNYEITRLDVIKTNYEHYKEKRAIESLPYVEGCDSISEGIKEKVALLFEDYRKADENYNNQLSVLVERTGQRDVDGLLEKLLKGEPHVARCFNRISGVREKVNYLIQCEKEWDDKKDDILRAMEQIMGQCNEASMDNIRNIKMDKFNQFEVFDDIDVYKKELNNLQSINEKTRELQEEMDRLKIRRDTLNRGDNIKSINGYLYISTGLILLSIILYFLNIGLGVITGTAGIVGTGLYYFFKGISQKERIRQLNDLNLHMEKISWIIDNEYGKISDINKKVHRLKGKLDILAKRLGCSGDISPDLLREYYKSILSIKEKIYDYDVFYNKIDNLKEEIMKEMDVFHEIIKEFDNLSSKHTLITGLQERINMTLSDMEDLHETLSIARTLDNTKGLRDDLEKRLRALIGANFDHMDIVVAAPIFVEMCTRKLEYRKNINRLEEIKRLIVNSVGTERIMKAIKAGSITDCIDAEKAVELFDKLCSNYNSVAEIEREYTRSVEKLEEETRTLDIKKEERQSIKDRLEILETSDRMVKAQNTIENAREGLLPLARKYAVYRSAALICREYRNNILHNMKDSYLKRAGDILSTVSGGEVCGIMPSDNMLMPDFKTLFKDGKTLDKVDYLSRGTREQLYMAVRLSRIMDMNPKLPVVVDDALVNFDKSHTEKYIRVLFELSKTNQIFFFTCHSHITDEIKRIGQAQFWKIHGGNIYKTH